jgi:pyrroline-5-carboxylate reductase
MQNTPTIAFLGAGNITQSLVGGLIQQGYPASRIWVTNPTIKKLHKLQSQYGLHITHDNQEAAHAADVIVLAVKPSIVLTVCDEIHAIVQQKKNWLISIAAGITTTAIQTAIKEACPIVRAMPNTPVKVNAGVTGLYANLQIDDEKRNYAETLFRSVGITHWVLHEHDLNAITALFGSGPAYFYYMMEALEAAAIAQGLTAEAAHLLTIQTAFGAAKLALESNMPLAELRQKITSPQGTTAAALTVLQQENVVNILAKAVDAARKRAEELAAAE